MEHKTKTKLKLLLHLLMWWCLAGCQQHSSANMLQAEGDTLEMRHAKLLTIIAHPQHLEAIIRNPWDTTQVLHHYVMTHRDRPTSVPNGATLVHIPLQKAAVFTSVHCGLLQELGCSKAIGGVCEVKYIQVPDVIEGIQQGSIADLGSGMAPNIERIMALQPDALMPTPFENTGGYGRLEKLGIPIIECAEYMEVSPLAQAEWIRFYGRLFGKAEEADSLFDVVESTYLNLKEKAAKNTKRPLLIAELPQSGKWYVPAGKSTLGQLYHDAGANYAFAHLSGAGSSALSIEHVLDKALHADIWLVKHFGKASREQLTADIPALNYIKAPMWLCDTQTSLYYEEIPFHPEWLLAHLMSILHPQMNVNSPKTYFHPAE